MGSKSAVDDFIRFNENYINGNELSVSEVIAVRLCIELACAIQRDMSYVLMLEVHVKDLIRRVDDLEAIKKGR